MSSISRRKFISKSLLAAPVIVLGRNSCLTRSGLSHGEEKKSVIKAVIPRPLQLVIDDVGWWSGEDGSKRQEPYRTGINRNHVPADYKAIAELGKALGIRPQAAMILCEWDKKNILRELPSATWMGDKWDNSKWIGPWMEEAADIIRSNSRNYEITLHGVGHEYWEGGTFTRAEWTDSKGKMRPPEEVERHLEYYSKIMDQHKLGPFPVSFVPAAFRHCFGRSEGREISLAEILKRNGITYINTPFSIMYNNDSVKENLFGFDSGVITVDRGEDQFSWDIFPGDPVADIKGPTCGIHWPNMLHPDPERNPEIVGRWIKYLKRLNEKDDMVLAADSSDLQHQLVHHKLTRAGLKGNTLELDFSETDRLPGEIGRIGLIIKVVSLKPVTFRTRDIKIVSNTLIRKENYLYSIRLERESGKGRAQIHFS